jgi:hypothetical protein
LEDLGQNASDPKHDARAELRVSYHTADDFPATFDHFLNQQGFTPRDLQQAFTFISHLFLGLEVEHHSSHLGFMRQSHSRCFQDNWKPDSRGR